MVSKKSECCVEWVVSGLNTVLFHLAETGPVTSVQDKPWSFTMFAAPPDLASTNERAVGVFLLPPRH
jgi:hypothetical protein